MAQNVLPRRNHWSPEARVKKAGVLEESKMLNIPPVTNPVVPERGISG